MKGSIYPFKDRWAGAISCGKDSQGKRKRITVYGDSKKDVENKINKILYEISTGDYVEPVKDSLISFLKEYHKICAGYDMWTAKTKRPAEAKWEETTAALNKMYIDVHFEPHFSDMKLTDIKPMTLDKFYNEKLSKTREIKIMKMGAETKKIIPPLSINTVIKLNKFLMSAFNYAIKNGLLKNNPAKLVNISKKVKYKPNVYTEEQITELINKVFNEDEEVPIVLGAGCGLRRGEICGLRWKDIDFENKIITVEKTTVRFNKNIEKKPKNETSSRSIIVPDYVIEVLTRHLIKRAVVDIEEKVIIKWKPQSLSGRFKALLDSSGMDPTRLHDLRHYNAVIMMKYGTPDKVAAERLGHSNVSTLRDIYQHVFKDMDEKAANSINSTYKKEI